MLKTNLKPLVWDRKRGEYKAPRLLAIGPVETPKFDAPDVQSRFHSKKRVTPVQRFMEEVGTEMWEDVIPDSKSHAEWARLKAKHKKERDSAQADMDEHDRNWNKNFEVDIITYSKDHSNKLREVLSEAQHTKEVTKAQAKYLMSLVTPIITRKFVRKMPKFTERSRKLTSYNQNMIEAVLTKIREKNLAKVGLNFNEIMVILDVAGAKNLAEQLMKKKAEAGEPHYGMQKRRDESDLEYKTAEYAWKKTKPIKGFKSKVQMSRKPKPPPKTQTRRPVAKKSRKAGTTRVEPTIATQEPSIALRTQQWLAQPPRTQQDRPRTFQTRHRRHTGYAPRKRRATGKRSVASNEGPFFGKPRRQRKPLG
ncbi:MAG TPA: hypothetical protein EYP00_04720 [Dehalococcoidia bacterium]|nr:hypothetical protein [Dehalococcoidia bacterium]